MYRVDVWGPMEAPGLTKLLDSWVEEVTVAFDFVPSESFLFVDKCYNATTPRGAKHSQNWVVKVKMRGSMEVSTIVHVHAETGL